MNAERINKNISYFFEKGDLSEEDLLYICQVCFDYLNPTPVSELEILGKHYVLNNE